MAPVYPRLVACTSAVFNILLRFLMAKCILDRTHCNINDLPASLRDFPYDLEFSDAAAKCSIYLNVSHPGLLHPL